MRGRMRSNCGWRSSRFRIVYAGMEKAASFQFGVYRQSRPTMLLASWAYGKLSGIINNKRAWRMASETELGVVSKGRKASPRPKHYAPASASIMFPGYRLPQSGMIQHLLLKAALRSR